MSNVIVSKAGPATGVGYVITIRAPPPNTPTHSVPHSADVGLGDVWIRHSPGTSTVSDVTTPHP